MKTVRMLTGSFQCGDTYITKGKTGEVEDHVASDLVRRKKAGLVSAKSKPNKASASKVVTDPATAS